MVVKIWEIVYLFCGYLSLLLAGPLNSPFIIQLLCDVHLMQTHSWHIHKIESKESTSLF